MPFAINGSVRLFWRLEGSPANPPVMLLHAIGTDMSIWDRMIPSLLQEFRVLRMDIRGHGASDICEGDYSLPMLADDAICVLDAAGISRAALVGVSLGGMIAMETALRAPDRVVALALVCTSANMDRQTWSERIVQTRTHGMRDVADMAIQRLLSGKFARNNPVIAEGLHASLAAMSAAGYAGAAAAIRDMTLTGRIAQIAVPVLIVSGERDVATPFDPHGTGMVTDIAGARSQILDCGHLPPIEAPLALAGLLRTFLLAKPETQTAAATLFEAGTRNRRRILGDAWVDQSLAARTPFNADFQEMIMRTAWQEIWSRSGLDDRTRRLLVIAITATQGRWEEFCLHVRSGLEQDGFTSDELKETLMQLAVYAGVPAANTAFAEAGKIIANQQSH